MKRTQAASQLVVGRVEFRLFGHRSRAALEALQQEMEAQALSMLALARQRVASPSLEGAAQPPAPPAREKRRARPQDTSQVLTVQEAAARLRMDRNEVYTHIRTGKLVSLQQTPGGKHRIPVWALKQFLKEEANGEARQR